MLDDKAMKEKNSADLLKAMKKSATANLEKKQEKAQKKAEKIPFYLKGLVFLQTDAMKLAKLKRKDDQAEVKRQKEKDREEARKKKGGLLRRMAIGDKGASKKGGIFGALKSIGGGIMNIFSGKGFVFKILGKLFKVLKFIVGGVALLAVGAFLMADPSTQKKIIDGVIGFFTKVGEFLKMLGDAFASGFMSNIEDSEDGSEGLKTKFKKFQEAWGKAFKAINEMQFTVMGNSYKGLAGLANMLGDIFGKVAGWVLDLATGIANFISDPRKVMTEMSVAISNFFGGMIDTVGRFIDKYTSMEFLMTLLPAWARNTDFIQGKMQEASQERADEKLQEMKDLSDRDKRLAQREVSAQESYDKHDKRMTEIKAEIKAGEGKLTDEERENLLVQLKTADEKRIGVYDLLLEAKAERERNKDRFEYAKESYEDSSAIALRQTANTKLKSKKQGDFIAIEEKQMDLEEEKQELKKDTVGGATFKTGEIDVGLSTGREIKEILGGKDKVTKADLNKAGIAIKLAELGLDDSQVDNLSKINYFLGELAIRERKILKNNQDLEKQRLKKEALQPMMDKALDEARALALQKSGGVLPTIEMDQEKNDAAVTPGPAVTPIERVKKDDGAGTGAVPSDDKDEGPIVIEGMTQKQLVEKYDIKGKAKTDTTDNYKLLKRKIRAAKKRLKIGTPMAEQATIIEETTEGLPEFKSKVGQVAADSTFDEAEQTEIFDLIQTAPAESKKALQEFLFGPPVHDVITMIPATGAM